MISRHEVFVHSIIRHFLYDLENVLAIPSREQKLCRNILCKDLTKKKCSLKTLALSRAEKLFQYAI